MGSACLGGAREGRTSPAVNITKVSCPRNAEVRAFERQSSGRAVDCRRRAAVWGQRWVLSVDPPPLRRALLGAGACAAIAGVALERALDPAHAVVASSSVASSSDSAIVTPPSPGPASFADIVDRVEPAVVSVKVKIADSDRAGRSGFAGRPRFPAGQPVLSFLPSLRTAGRRRRLGSAQSYDDGAGVRFLHLRRRLHRHQQSCGRPRERRHHHAGERQDHAGQGDRGRQEDRSGAC